MLFLSESFGIETINAFIHSRSSSKIYNRFADRNGAKTTPFGAAHTYTAFIMQYPSVVYCVINHKSRGAHSIVLINQGKKAEEAIGMFVQFECLGGLKSIRSCQLLRVPGKGGSKVSVSLIRSIEKRSLEIISPICT